MPDIHVTAGVKTQTALSQQMMQSLRVLQMSNHELQEYLTEEAGENPFLNMTPPPVTGGGSADPAEYAENAPCLYEDVLRQIYNAFPDESRRDIALFFAERMDESGFCTATDADAARRLRVDEDECNGILRALRRFEPEGVFSADLLDCISFRMQRRGVDKEECIRVMDALPYVPKRGADRCADMVKMQRYRFKELLLTIKSLRTPPAAGYNRTQARTRTADCFVTLNEHDMPMVTLNPDALPQVTFSSITLSGADNSPAVKTKLQQARIVCDSVGKRHDTLYNIADVIVKKQRLFFQLGVNYMAPLTLSEVAAAAGVHESTASRAAKEKTLSYRGKLYDLKFFFGSAATASDGEHAVSASAAKARLRDIIDREDTETPLSDEALTECLAKEGICISRRTVMKYRSVLAIPSSTVRKRMRSLAN